VEAQTVIELTYRALQLVIVLLLPPLGVSVVVGLLIAFAEAITQIQDQSIGTAVKIIAVLITLMLTAHWMGASTLEFGRMLMDLIVTVRAPARS
jgi:type III secretion protein S